MADILHKSHRDLTVEDGEQIHDKIAGFTKKNLHTGHDHVSKALK